MKLNYHDRSSRVRSMIKMTLDNGVIDRTCAVYAENEIEPS